MGTAMLRRPFMVVNPKAYLYGDEVLALAKKADGLAQRYHIDCLFTAQDIDLPSIVAHCSHLIPCAQSMEGFEVGRGMGHRLPAALAAAGVKATFLNHAENPLTIHELALAIAYAKRYGLLTVVCADSVEEAKAIASFKPDVMVCELTSLIGTGTVADEDYMRSSTQAVKEASPETLVLQAAGIHSGQNIYDAIALGADGSGGTSGIVCADDPAAVLEDMFSSLAKAREDFCGGDSQ